MTAGYRPASPGRPGSSRPGSPGVHTKVEEDLHNMAGIDFDKVSILITMCVKKKKSIDEFIYLFRSLLNIIHLLLFFMKKH